MTSVLKTTKGFLSQSFINLFGNAVASFLAFLFNFLVIKTLSMANYGEYTGMTAYLGFLTAPLTIMAIMITRKVSQEETAARPVMAAKIMHLGANWLKKSGWLIFAGVILGVILAKTANFSDFFTAPLIVILILLSLVTTIFTAILTGWQAFIGLVTISILAALFKLVGGFGLLKLEGNLGSVYLIMLATATLQMILNWWLIRKKIKAQTQKKIKLTLIDEKKAWWEYGKKRSLWVPLIGVITTSALISVDMMTVKMVAAADFAGAFGLYALFGKILLYASNPLINVAFTFFNQPSEERQKKQVFALAAGLILLFVLGMIGLYKLYPELLIVLVGKSDYLILAPYLWLAAVFGGLYSIALLLTQYLIAKNRRLVYLGLLIPVGQMLAIYFYHQNLQEIMLINIAACIALIGVYSLGFYYKKRKNATATV